MVKVGRSLPFKGQRDAAVDQDLSVEGDAITLDRGSKKSRKRKASTVGFSEIPGANATRKRAKTAQPPVRGTRALSMVESSVRPDTQTLLDNGVTDQLGHGCKVVMMQSGVVLDATLALPAPSVGEVQQLRLQFLHTGSSESPWRVWCRKGVSGQGAGEFLVLGDGALNSAWHAWYDVFSKHTGLRWIDRNSTPVVGRWVYLPRANNGSSPAQGHYGSNAGWRPAQAATKRSSADVEDLPVMQASEKSPKKRALSTLEDASYSIDGPVIQNPKRPKLSWDAEEPARDGGTALDVGVIEKFGYQCRVYTKRTGAVYDATLLSPSDAVRFCRMQALVIDDSAYYVWVREGKVGDHGVATVYGNGELWGIFKWFHSRFKMLTGFSWGQRLEADQQPGYYKYIEGGMQKLNLNPRLNQDEPRSHKAVKIETDLTEDDIKGEPVEETRQESLERVMDSKTEIKDEDHDDQAKPLWNVADNEATEELKMELDLP